MQQSFEARHDASTALQLAPQRSTPMPSGRHGVPPQHSSVKLQTLPEPTQQFGFVLSYPSGHSAVEPPKHRGVPFASTRQHCALGDMQLPQFEGATEASHSGVSLLQTLPSGVFPVRTHRPYASPAFARLHVCVPAADGAAPQQSSSL